MIFPENLSTLSVGTHVSYMPEGVAFAPDRHGATTFGALTVAGTEAVVCTSGTLAATGAVVCTLGTVAGTGAVVCSLGTVAGTGVVSFWNRSCSEATCQPLFAPSLNSIL